MKFFISKLSSSLPLAAMLGACSDDPVITRRADLYEYVDEQLAGNGGDYRGFYVLQLEGAMGN